MCKVLVIDPKKRPLNPIHPAQARQLLRNKKAAIFRRFPFIIILKEARLDSPVSPLRLKLDPGAKTTGIALLNDSTGEVVFAAELKHRGFAIRDALTSRRQLRRSRRNRQTRYRQPRFNNRTRPQGWLAPSLQSRIENIKTWVEKLCKFAPIEAISQELVKFDLQLMRNPEIQGKEYQQGSLAGYETREYLLEKWDRQCAYCGVKEVPLQIEHIHPRSKGGSNSITNLTLSSEKCNIKKGTKDIRDFLKKEPTKLHKILSHTKKPLADAAAVNVTRFALLKVLKSTLLRLAQKNRHFDTSTRLRRERSVERSVQCRLSAQSTAVLSIECGSGGLTKFNRNHQNLPKTHWIDAACVGKSTPVLKIKGIKPLLITANGHGSRQSCRTDKFGFPNRHVPRKKIHFNFQTGDIVKAVVTRGKKVGDYVGKVAIRSSGSFNISDRNGLIQGISHKFCKRIHAKDGYSYAT